MNKSLSHLLSRSTLKHVLKRTLLLHLCLLSSAPLFADTPLRFPFSIIGGQRVGENEWPANTSVWVTTDQNCSGVMVAPQWILTAAHCSEGLRSTSLRAIATFGVDPSSSTAPFSVIDRVVLHPSYPVGDPQSFLSGYDLALLHLSDPAPRTSVPALLPSATPSRPSPGEDEAILLTGYGAFRAGASGVAPRLRQILLNQRKATSVIGEPRLQNALLLIADQTLGIGACTGDSGGGVYAYVAATPVLAGIIAGGPKDCADYSVITRIAPHLEWIRETIQR